MGGGPWERKESSACEGIELVYRHEKRERSVQPATPQTVLAFLGSSRDARSSQGGCQLVVVSCLRVEIENELLAGLRLVSEAPTRC